MTAPTREQRTTPALPYTHVDTFFIDGQWRPAATAERSPVVDPATGQEWASVPVATAAELDDAVDAARAALPGWSDLTAAERAEYLLRTAERMSNRFDKDWENLNISDAVGASACFPPVFPPFLLLGLLLLGQVPTGPAVLGIGFVVVAGVGAERTGAREVEQPTHPG